MMMNWIKILIYEDKGEFIRRMESQKTFIICDDKYSNESKIQSIVWDSQKFQIDESTEDARWQICDEVAVQNSGELTKMLLETINNQLFISYRLVSIVVSGQPFFK